jgi:hypothetical protein
MAIQTKIFTTHYTKMPPPADDLNRTKEAQKDGLAGNRTLDHSHANDSSHIRKREGIAKGVLYH